MQRRYGQYFKIPEVYTPQMVLNGESAFVGTDSRALLKGRWTLIRRAAGSLHIASAKVEGDKCWRSGVHVFKRGG